MKDPYSVLGVSRDATDEQIKQAYRELVKKYHPDNYSEDNPLKDLATDKMQEINEAYDEIQRIREDEKNGKKSYTGEGQYGYTSQFNDVRILINQKRFGDAGRKLASVPDMDRTAEWHYLMSVVLMQRGNINDAMRELETACTMDPSNLEYQRAKTMFNNTARGYGSTYYNNAGGTYPQRSSADDACNCCANLICLDCLCECLGGDLIRCI